MNGARMAFCFSCMWISVITVESVTATATEAAVEAEQVEDEQVVHSIAPAEPEEEWNFFF